MNFIIPVLHHTDTTYRFVEPFLTYVVSMWRVLEIMNFIYLFSIVEQTINKQQFSLILHLHKIEYARMSLPIFLSSWSGMMQPYFLFRFRIYFRNWSRLAVTIHSNHS